ncbi:MAG: ester cyclase [Sphingomonadales bacterium]|nr:ester cyclase [Sphingomonadales bacterium]
MHHPRTDAAAKAADTLVSALITAVNAQDWGALGALASADCTSHGLPFVGPMALIAPFAELRAALPDLHLSAEPAIVTGEEIMVRYHGQGVQRGYYGSVPPKGATVQVEGMDVLHLADGRIRSRRSYMDRLVLVQQMTDPQPGSLDKAIVPTKIVTRFDPPTFLEGVLVGNKGEVYVTPLHEGTVYRVWPDGRREKFFHVEAGHGPWNGAWCMVAAADGDGFFLNVNAADPARHGVWRITADGQGRPFAALPPGTIPNGIARTKAGDLLIADSTGCVWRIDGQGRPTVWLRHEWLAGRPNIGRFPGANGIQVWNQTAFVTNSDLGLIIAVPIAADGSAGTPSIYSEGIGGDDFAIDDDGTLYVTTHPFNTVVRIGRDGRRAVIAGAAEGVVGPTAAALGRDQDGQRVLYVVTDGGMFTLPEGDPVPPAQQTPALLKLRLP